VTLVAIWLTDTRVVPRFVSYLLVPLLMLLATGIARLAREGVRFRLLRSAAAVVVVLLAVAGFAAAGDVLRWPREAWRDAAAVVDNATPSPAVVVVHAYQPDSIAFYSRTPVVTSPEPGEAACVDRRGVALVVSLWRQPSIAIPCKERPGVRHMRLSQYARGGFIDVWLIPPRR
jgi:hypothetical protein